MAFRFTIGKKIGTGFGVLILFVIIVFYSTYQTLNSSIKINDDITNVNNPSVASLEELRLLVVRSKMLIFNWIYIQSAPESPDKKKLIQLKERDYPYIEKRIKELSPNWDKRDQEKITKVFANMEQLFELHEEVKMLLPDWDSYEDAESKFLANFMVGDDGDIYTKTNEILYQLNDLIDNQKFESTSVTESMQSSFSFLKQLFKILGIALVIGGCFNCHFYHKNYS